MEQAEIILCKDNYYELNQSQRRDKTRLYYETPSKTFISEYKAAKITYPTKSP